MVKHRCLLSLTPADSAKPMPNFAQSLLHWFDKHGRKNLPWQNPITPYRVWLSEIMLQQTQVETVIPYFEGFVDSFDGFEQLAEANIDEVLHLWTGLGYYARARNLHKCAQTVVEKYQGEMPEDPALLEALPGIGRSTAAAIASIAFEKPCAILDGNVKRVLARHHAVPGWPGKSDVIKQLWQHAEQHMPQHRCRDYTQAIMDLGASLCSRSKPACVLCPVADTCVARKQGNPQAYPGKKPKKNLPVKQIQMLILRNRQGEVLLEQRPPAGIWGGLWSFPELAPEDASHKHVQTHFGKIAASENWSVLKHTFSHYHLEIQPVLIDLEGTHSQISESGSHTWYNPLEPKTLGLAAPVLKLLGKL